MSVKLNVRIWNLESGNRSFSYECEIFRDFFRCDLVDSNEKAFYVDSSELIVNYKFHTTDIVKKSGKL